MSPMQQLTDLLDLDSSEHRLTDWEVEFVDSVDKKIRQGGEMSPRQEAVVSKVWDAVFIHGQRKAKA